MIAVALIAAAALAGHVRHASGPVTLMPNLQGMSLLTALGLLTLCGALLADSANRVKVAWPLACTTVGLGVVSLAAHLIAGRDVISVVLEQSFFEVDAAHAAQMSVATAMCLVALGGAILSRVSPWSCDALGALVLVIAGVALLGYAYGVRDLYGVYMFRTMALHTAAGLFILALGSLLMRPDRGLASIVFSGGVGGQATRRQLAFMLVPPGIGFLLLQSMSAGHIGVAAAMALLVVSTIVPLGMLILRDGHALNELDKERRHRALQQAAAATELTLQLDAQAVALQRESADRATAELSLARAQRMEAIGQLTGGIAHDFNNLLMAIGGNLQLILKRLDSEHPARRFVVNAQSALARGGKLTAQLLTFSRTQKLDIRAIEIDVALAASRDLLIPTLGSHVVVRTLLEARDAWALADPAQLELAILNLALNAREAMPGGGELWIESGTCRARLGTSRDDQDFVFIRVCDKGAGMTPAVVARAVEPFFTTKERGRGSGLGLAQVYGFARQCGGDLTIDSEPGRGTNIQLLLPRTTAPAQAAGTEQIELKTDGTAAEHRLLLVIDDDDSVRSVLVEALRDSGFTVMEASNGESGLELLKQHAPAVAIIDFLMPGLNGADVARRARRQRPRLPIIFVSGYYDTMALDEIGGAVVLRKPVDLAQLRRTIISVVSEN